MRLVWHTDGCTPHLRCYYSASRIGWFICIRTHSHSIDVWREHNFYPLVQHLNNAQTTLTVYYVNIHLSGLMI